MSNRFKQREIYANKQRYALWIRFNHSVHGLKFRLLWIVIYIIYMIYIMILNYLLVVCGIGVFCGWLTALRIPSFTHKPQIIWAVRSHYGWLVYYALFGKKIPTHVPLAYNKSYDTCLLDRCIYYPCIYRRMLFIKWVSLNSYPLSVSQIDCSSVNLPHVLYFRSTMTTVATFSAGN